MAYSSQILADSVSEAGHRITTFEITIPRIMLSEFNTHRMLSRNSASSRAIPVARVIDGVEEDPFIPELFGSHQKGMVAGEPLNEDKQNMARHFWQGGLDAAVDYARGLESLGVYKGLANRLLEPFKWHTIISTGTDWSNFFALRTGGGAQAEIRKVALMMQEQYQENKPMLLGEGEWAIPLVSSQEFIEEGQDYGYWVPVSIGRCARVSYERQHDASDPDGDVKRHDGLLGNRHLSPFEHVARPFTKDEWGLIDDMGRYLHDAGWMARLDNALASYLLERLEYAGNLHGWWSARMDIPNESDADALHS